MPEYKSHLSIRHRRQRLAACGKPDARFLTDDPSRVTCGGCQRTLAMADAEMAQSQAKSKRRTRRERH